MRNRIHDGTVQSVVSFLIALAISILITIFVWRFIPNTPPMSWKFFLAAATAGIVVYVVITLMIKRIGRDRR